MRKALTFIVALAIFTATPRAQTPPTLDQVLERLRTYLAAYAAQYASTLAKERYSQTYGSNRTRTQTHGERTLEAEFGIVHVPGASQWLAFRDVVSVDEQPVADHEGRLATLFLDPSADALKRAEKITEESTRFNIGPIRRTINDPTIVLEALDAPNQARFKFSKGGEETIDGIRTWMLRFVEPTRPTFVRSFSGDNEPLTGRAWVDPVDGRLVRGEISVKMVTTSGPFTCRILVTFREEARLGMWVPATMIERYDTEGNVFATGDAKYTDYRKFGVETKEDLAK